MQPHEQLSDRQWQLLMSTYENRQHLIVENEALGERRLQTYLTVVSACGVALGLAAEQFDDTRYLKAIPVVCLLLALLGVLTVARVAQRDAATSWLKFDLYRIRLFVADNHAGLLKTLPHMVDHEHRRHRPWWPARGGLVEVIAVLSCAFAGGGAAIWYHIERMNELRSFVLGVVVAVAVWLMQIAIVRWVYKTRKVLAPARPRSSDASRRSPVD
jgi:hypothetical protein